jgi:hypothetical protein
MGATGGQENFRDTKILFQKVAAFLCEVSVPGNSMVLNRLLNIFELIPCDAGFIKIDPIIVLGIEIRRWRVL